MEIYLVGGAVRDELLGRPVTERDWVVVGSSPEEMVSLGFSPVGKEFPVFLHPETGEEYALARTERKTGKGYKGFAFKADKDVTLEEDLLRRDLTVNAIAQSESGQLIDPYHGQEDLKNKVLKHVSAAFAEDPVRILRIARFSARFGNFTIHPDTLKLMQEMVTAGEVDALVPERVWKECYRALEEASPSLFFDVLDQCHALSILFPEITKTHNMKALEKCAELSKDGPTRFAALLHDVSANAVKSLCNRHKAPNEYKELAILVAKNHAMYHQLNLKDAESVVVLLETLDCFRRPGRLEGFVIACLANGAAIDGLEYLQKALSIAKAVSTQPFIDQGLEGKDIAKALHVARVEALK